MTSRARSFFALDGALWRRLAWLGAVHGPEWWLRHSPPAFGLAAAALVPSARRRVAENLLRVRGKVPLAREAREVAATFAVYARCLAEGLAAGSRNGAITEVEGSEHIRAAVARGRGLIMATAHTAGWELTGPSLARDHELAVTIVMAAERSGAAMALHDGVRRANGVEVAHVGADPFTSLSLVHQLRKGGAVAMQIDRMPRGMRARRVRLFDQEGGVPDGPIRLAELTGATLLPVFSARLGFLHYRVHVSEGILVPRPATEVARNLAAQQLADTMTAFIRARPTQWFHFAEASR